MESGSRKTVTLGSSEVALADQSCGVVYADCMTEFRQANGTVSLSLGCIRVDGNEAPIIDVVARLRMNIVTAQVIRDFLAQAIDDATKPADTSRAN